MLSYMVSTVEISSRNVTVGYLEVLGYVRIPRATKRKFKALNG